MKILIDDGMQIDVNTGIGKYTKYLFNYLKKNCVDVSLKKHHNNAKKKIFGRLKYLIKVNSNKYKAESKEFDIIHFTNFVIPFRRNKNVKYAVTIHDLVCYKCSNTLPFLYRLYAKLTTKYSIKHADMIFTVSESIKNEIIEYFPKVKEKVVVGYPGLYDEMANTLSKETYDNDLLKNINSKFFLFIGTIESRKNIDFVLDAFFKFKEKYKNDYKLILAGKPGYGYDKFKEKVDNSKYNKDIIFTGFISSNDACLLYNNASAYIFPSIYEGFGSPQLESMIHHIPLILSSIPTNIEISKDYGLFFDLDDVESLIEQMKLILDNRYNYNEKNNIADKIVERFKWNSVIKSYICNYQDLNKIKICHIIGDFINGGVESVICNYFSNIDLNKFNLFIIGHGITIKECADRFSDLGFKIYNVTPKRVNVFKNIKEMNKIIKENKFDIVHSHLTEWACVPMILGFFNNVKVRINHSHMAEKPKGLKNKIYYGTRLWLGKLFATDYFACGKAAGIYLFGRKNVENGKVKIMHNAVDVNEFSYNDIKRNFVRKENDIKDTDIVIGHVGRFFKQKNHSFLIEIFKELHIINTNFKLYLFGDGELINQIKEEVNSYKLDNYIKFMGVRSDLSEWYQAMDLFILPSLYEGLPVVGVEAQMSGLPCYFSNTITDEIKITQNAKFIDLNKTAKEWAEIINKDFKESKRILKNEIDDKYNIKKNAKWLEEFYIQKVKS